MPKIDIDKIAIDTSTGYPAPFKKAVEGRSRKRLGRVTADVTLAGISSDRLYPLRLQHELAARIPRNSGVEVIQSISGHDGFLTETEAVGKVITRALADI